MRAGNRPPQGEGRERYLGEIAPLLEAARSVDSLPPERKRQVRRRILRSAFGRRRWGARSRLTPLFAALGLLAVGSAAFAMAERWGLLPRFDFPNMGPPVLPAIEHPRKHRAVRPASIRPSQVAPTQEPAAVVPAETPAMLPDVPDPLLAEPVTSVSLSRPVSNDGAVAEATPRPPRPSLSVAPPARSRVPARPAPVRMAMAESPTTLESGAWSRPEASRSFWSQPTPVISPHATASGRRARGQTHRGGPGAPGGPACSQGSPQRPSFVCSSHASPAQRGQPGRSARPVA
jgi:hypothetical protein